MATPSFVIRLDIDTMVCAKSITYLLHLADQLNCRFSFFINIGRSISIPAAIFRRCKPTTNHYHNNDTTAKKLSIKQKIGIKGIIETIMLNKELLPLCQNELLQAKSHGHEVGLHGGMNHGIWQSYAHFMSDEEISLLLQPAIEKYTDAFGEGYGFTSPGFSLNSYSYEILAKNGCRYVSDHIDKKGVTKVSIRGGLPDIPVTLAAKGGIDYLESYVASNNTTPLNVIAQKSIGQSNYSVLYSHPCFIKNIGTKVFCEFIKEIQKIAENKLLIELL